MTTHFPVRDNRPNDELHPLIYQFAVLPLMLPLIGFEVIAISM